MPAGRRPIVRSISATDSEPSASVATGRIASEGRKRTGAVVVASPSTTPAGSFSLSVIQTGPVIEMSPSGATSSSVEPESSPPSSVVA